MSVVLTYTRAQAIEDGALVDVSEMARKAGFIIPVAITNAAWEDCVVWTGADRLRKTAHQDEDRRLWNVLWMLHCAIRQSSSVYGNVVVYSLRRVPRDGQSTRAEPVQLKSVCGPGDDYSPVITVMLPNED